MNKPWARGALWLARIDWNSRWGLGGRTEPSRDLQNQTTSPIHLHPSSHLQPRETSCCQAPLRSSCSSASAPPPASGCPRRKAPPAGHGSLPTARVSSGSRSHQNLILNCTCFLLLFTVKSNELYQILVYNQFQDMFYFTLYKLVLL